MSNKKFEETDKMSKGTTETIREIQDIVRSGVQNYLFRALHKLDSANLSPEEFNRLNLELVHEAFANPQAIRDHDARYFFEGIFSHRRNRDEMLAKLVEDRKVQPTFRKWVEERFRYYDSEGSNESASLIGSLGGLEINIWNINAMKRLTQLFRGHGYSGNFEWFYNTLDYAKAFIEATHYPKEYVLLLAKGEAICHQEKEIKEFMDWLRG